MATDSSLLLMQAADRCTNNQPITIAVTTATHNPSPLCNGQPIAMATGSPLLEILSTVDYSSHCLSVILTRAAGFAEASSDSQRCHIRPPFQASHGLTLVVWHRASVNSRCTGRPPSHCQR